LKSLFYKKIFDA
jgi:hypothetical protein